MNVSPTLTKAEFADVHNAKCELHGILQSLEGVIHPMLQHRLEKAVALLDKGMTGAYEQDEAAHEKAQAHYNEVSTRIGARTIGAKDDVTDLDAPFSYKEVFWLRYTIGQQSWRTPVLGTAWADLWRAAENLILRSGDMHHIFIEEFHATEDAGVLSLSTGS